MIHKWFTEIRCGHTSTKDTEYPGRPSEVITQKNIYKIYDVVSILYDRLETSFVNQRAKVLQLQCMI